MAELPESVPPDAAREGRAIPVSTNIDGRGAAAEGSKGNVTVHSVPGRERGGTVLWTNRRAVTSTASMVAMPSNAAFIWSAVASTGIRSDDSPM